MADTKISALTSSTIPLAGTEVLPIVQSGSTVKVSIDDLTAGKPVSCSQLGVGGAFVTGISLAVVKAATGATTSRSVRQTAQIQSDVTSRFDGYNSIITTQATPFTLASLHHFIAEQSTIGAGSIVTNQFGFVVGSTPTGATNNYGVYSNIASPTSGVQTSATISSVSCSGTTATITTSSAHGYTNGQTVTITATANATALTSGALVTILTVGTTDFTAIGAASNTVGISFTATGAGTGTGTVTLNMQGSGKAVAGSSGSVFTVTAPSATYTDITVLSGTVTVSKRFNFYANGTAPNWFNSDVLIYGAGGIGYAIGSGGAVTQITSRTTGVTLDKTNGEITLVSAAGSTTWQTFTVTNNKVAATDVVIVNQKSGTDLHMIHVTNVAAGSFKITFATTGGTTTESPVFNFAVIKAATA